MPEFLSGISSALRKVGDLGTEFSRRTLKLALHITDKAEYEVNNPDPLKEALASGRGVIIVANHTVADYASKDSLIGKLTKTSKDTELQEKSGGLFLPTDALLLRRLVLELTDQLGDKKEPHIMARVNHSTRFGSATDKQELGAKVGTFTRIQDIMKLIPTAPFSGYDPVALQLNLYAKQEAKSALEAGGVIIVFPQDEAYDADVNLNATPISQTFAKLGMKSNSLIVPITTHGTNETFKLATGKTKANFTVGEVIDPTLADAGNISQIAQKTWGEVVKGRQKTQATTT